MDTRCYPERAQKKWRDRGSSDSSADSNTSDAEATTPVWTCQAQRWKPYHQNSAGHGGRRCETERKTEIEIHGYHQKRHQEEWADILQHSRLQGLEIGSFQGDPLTWKSLQCEGKVRHALPDLVLLCFPGGEMHCSFYSHLMASN